MNKFERITVMIAMALIHLCFFFWGGGRGDSPLVYVKNKVLLLFFLPQLQCITVVMGIILAYARPFPIPGLRSFILYDNDLDGLVEYYYCPYLYDCNRWGYSQPSYSSTLLLLIFTNDMLEDLSSESSLYADESSLIKILHLQTIAAWAGTVEVNFKASKTVYMIVSKKCVVQNTFRCILTVNYFNVQCYCCRSGLWISEKMSWGYTSP